MTAIERHLLVLVGPAMPTSDELRVRANFQGMLRSVEEDLTDLLPEGWSAQIRPEFSQEEEANE